MRFLHAADIHLGNQQYNLSERYNDFYHSFERIAHTALTEAVNVCLIAGDLFHKAEIDPFTLLQAEACLRQMRDADIRVLAITGNHDRVIYRNAESWLGYLHRNNYLTLLDPGSQPFGLIPERTFIDLDGVRFIGVPYLGASTQAGLNTVVAQRSQVSWEGIHHTVLMVHYAVEGQHPDIAGTLRLADLQPLRQFVDYVALGHLHKPYVIDDWLYNPGSVETVEFTEAEYKERGVFIVTIDDSGINAQQRPLSRRPFETVYFEVDTYLNPNDLIMALRAAVRAQAAHWEVSDLAPVVRVILRGTLAFDRGALDIGMLTAHLKEDTRALVVRLELRLQGFELLDRGDGEITRDRLEREIFEDIARRDTRFSQHASEWAAWMRDLKEDALQGTNASQIYASLVSQMARTTEDQS
jgi:DNA repair exonuclease SbcCD nuclease subunit